MMWQVYRMPIDSDRMMPKGGQDKKHQLIVLDSEEACKWHLCFSSFGYKLCSLSRV